MANEIINSHDFEAAKSNIRMLAKSVPSPVSLKKFPTEGTIFSWNNHNITGKEANELLVSPLQSQLITFNSNILSLYKVANEVYRALESLDKDYIDAIVANVNAANIASHQAKAASSKAEQASLQALKASDEAKEASKRANRAQEDIKQTINGLTITVRSLKEFKEKVTKDLSLVASVSDSAKVLRSIQPYFSSLAHLKDVDEIWDNLERTRNIVKGLIDELTPFMNKVNKSDREIRDLISRLEELLLPLSHLSDMDAIWSDVESHKKDLAGFHQQVETFIGEVNRTTERIHSDISTLQEYRAVLESYKHLGDVDAIWSDVESHKKDLAGFHQQVETFIGEVNRTTERIHSDISTLQEYRAVLESYKHLGDVDAIWSDVESHKKDLAGFHQQVETFIGEVNRTTERIHSDISTLQEYRAVLESYKHLGDVDAIWSDVESHKKDLADFHQQVDRFMSEVRTAHLEINEYIQRMEQVNETAHLRYEKRIKNAYYIGGTAVGLSIINYVLQLLGIL